MRAILNKLSGCLLPFLLLGAGPAPERTPYPPQTILLFVAAWCAPCHGELAHLADISRGARPYRVLAVPFDESRATRAMLDAVPPSQRYLPDRATLRSLAAEVARQSAGLPFSLAIDQAGRPCGGHSEALDAASAMAMVERCRR